MKHTKKKRLLAIVLCMILVLSTGIAAFANENVGLQTRCVSGSNAGASNKKCRGSRDRNTDRRYSGRRISSSVMGLQEYTDGSHGEHTGN